MHFFAAGGMDAFLHSYGLLALAVIIALESTGFPLPGEASLVTAAILAATTHELSIVAVIACAAGAAIVGDNVGFLIGRSLGFPLLVRYGPRIGLDEPRLKLGQYLFRKHGGKIIFFGRFVALLRAFAALLAGANAYPWPSFLVFNAAGGIVWATLYGAGAYLFGRSIHKIAGPAAVVILMAVLIAVVASWRYLKRHEQMLQAEANAAMPGPLRA